MTDLARSIALHRALYRDDLHVERTVSRQPPTTLDLHTGLLEEEPADGVGMNLSGPMIRKLGHPDGYGAHHPWSKALWHVRSWCRRDHRRRYHASEPQWNGSLCHQMMMYTVVHGWSIQNAAAILDYNDPEPILREALQYIEDKIDDFRRAQERKARLDEGQALTCECGHGWSRHDDPASMFRCTACGCSRYRASKAA